MTIRVTTRLTAKLSILGAVATGCTHGSAPARCQTESAVPHLSAGGWRQTNPLLRLTGTGPTIADVVEQVLPSVVAVSTTRAAPETPFGMPLLPHFFGPGMQSPSPEPEQGLGSGVVVADGIVITNNHVVDGASQIKIATYDKHEYVAEKVGADPQSDLAVLRVRNTDPPLRPIRLGDSSRLRLGDVVLAVGHPFGVGETVTEGIVSAKGRVNLGIAVYEDFIQTDAAINPGNSGGALVNTDGELVGINTAILSRTGGNVGIGFAIPVNMAKPIVDSLLEHGRVVRGWLGVGIQEVTTDLAEALHLPGASGVLVTDVRPGTPAEKAGLRRGDVVLELNGQKVDSTGELRNRVAAAGAGRRATLSILRDGKPRTLTLELGELPAEPGQPGAPAEPEKAPGRGVDGLRLAPLDSATREAYAIPPAVSGGLVVTGIMPGTVGAAAGLQPGDVILEADREKVTTVDQFERHWSRARGPLALLVRRGEATLFVVVRKR